MLDGRIDPNLIGLLLSRETAAPAPAPALPARKPLPMATPGAQAVRSVLADGVELWARLWARLSRKAAAR